MDIWISVLIYFTTQITKKYSAVINSADERASAVVVAVAVALQIPSYNSSSELRFEKELREEYLV